MAVTETPCLESEYTYISETYGHASDEMMAYYDRDQRRVCTLPEGHDCEHEFTPTSEIVLTVKATPSGK